MVIFLKTKPDCTLLSLLISLTPLSFISWEPSSPWIDWNILLNIVLNSVAIFKGSDTIFALVKVRKQTFHFLETTWQHTHRITTKDYDSMRVYAEAAERLPKWGGTNKKGHFLERKKGHLQRESSKRKYTIFRRWYIPLYCDYIIRDDFNICFSSYIN